MKSGGIAIGLALAFIAQFVALVMTGAGHGWITPLYASLALWVLLPLTLAAALPFRPYSETQRPVVVGLALLAPLLDLVLILATINEGSQYFWKVVELGGPLPLMWIFIWLSWQAAAVLALSQGEECVEELR